MIYIIVYMDNFNRIAMRNWEKRCAHTQQSFPHELNYPNASNFICKKNETRHMKN
jgi:hypothetical protein